MVSKKTIVVIAVIVVVIAIIAIAASGGDDKPADARYDYTLEVTDSFIGDDGEVVTAPSGNDFAILTIAIANDHYDSGITTNDMINRWTVTVDGIEYSSSVWGFDHPLYVLGSITEGSEVTYALVFQVPDGTVAEDVTVGHEWVDFGSGPKFERDDSLL